MRYILASGSPRRKEILGRMGLDIEILVSEAEEITDKTKPEEMVMDLSLLKAEAAEKKLRTKEDICVIAADTLVWLDGTALGKPADEEAAFDMIKSISGRTHSVYTGVTLICIKNGSRMTDTFYDCTGVAVADIADEDIRAYIKTGEPMDKAGAYAIQGIFKKYIEAYDGSYDNVVGLPSELLKEHLEKISDRRK